MTDPSNPHPEISIQPGDYIVRSEGLDRERYVLCVVEIGEHDYETRRVLNASFDNCGDLVIPHVDLKPAPVLGRRSSLRIKGFAKEKRYRHVRAHDVFAPEIAAAIAAPVSPPALPDLLSWESLTRALVDSNRELAAALRGHAAALERFGVKGQLPLALPSGSASNGAQRAAG